MTICLSVFNSYYLVRDAIQVSHGISDWSITFSFSCSFLFLMFKLNYTKECTQIQIEQNHPLFNSIQFSLFSKTPKHKLQIFLRGLYNLYLQCIWKVFTALHFFHILLCYSLIPKWITFIIFLNILHTTTHNDKVKTVFCTFLQIC